MTNLQVQLTLPLSLVLAKLLSASFTSTQKETTHSQPTHSMQVKPSLNLKQPSRKCRTLLQSHLTGLLRLSLISQDRLSTHTSRCTSRFRTWDKVSMNLQSMYRKAMRLRLSHLTGLLRAFLRTQTISIISRKVSTRRYRTGPWEMQWHKQDVKAFRTSWTMRRSTGRLSNLSNLTTHRLLPSLVRIPTLRRLTSLPATCLAVHSLTLTLSPVM